MISQQILDFYFSLEKPTISIPEIETMNPYSKELTRNVVSQFYSKFFSDQNKRIAFIGINPGRFGSGITGIGFTDPVNLKQNCGIDHPFELRQELSSKFVYEVIEEYGGVSAFYSSFFITSVVPLGFTKNGVNLNYYDDKELEEELRPYIKKSFEEQLPFLRSDIAFCIGKGKNQKFLEKLNREEGYFERLEVLPHPRWVMQYRLKQKQEFIREFCQKLNAS